jgi:hypothetical protein
MSFHSTGIIRPFLQVDNLFRSYVLEEGFVSLQYEKHIHQNSPFRKDINYVDVIRFDQSGSKVSIERLDPVHKREEAVPPATMDPLALFSLYFLEQKGRAAERVELTTYDGYHVRNLRVNSANQELDTKLYGKIQTKCMQFRVVFTSMEGKQGDMKVWYADDENKYPVQLAVDAPNMSEVFFKLVRVERE